MQYEHTAELVRGCLLNVVISPTIVNLEPVGVMAIGKSSAQKWHGNPHAVCSDRKAYKLDQCDQSFRRENKPL